MAFRAMNLNLNVNREKQEEEYLRVKADLIPLYLRPAYYPERRRALLARPAS